MGELTVATGRSFVGFVVALASVGSSVVWRVGQLRIVGRGGESHHGRERWSTPRRLYCGLGGLGVGHVVMVGGGGTRRSGSSLWCTS